MKLLIHRMLVSTAIALVSVAPVSQAMAAAPHHVANLNRKANLHHKTGASVARAPYRYQAPLDVAAIPPYPNYSSGARPSPRTGAGYDVAARPAYPQGGRDAQWGYGPQSGYSYAVAAPGSGIGQMIAALLGGGVVSLNYGGNVAESGSSSYDFDAYTPAPDNSAADAAGWAAEQAANDAAAAAVAQENQDLADLNASIAAAEEQNDEAVAATQQTLINNGM